MGLRISDSKRLASGLIFLAIGVFAMTYGSRYRMGTATRMGPGYFPFIVASIVALLGFVAAATSLRIRGAPAAVEAASQGQFQGQSQGQSRGQDAAPDAAKGHQASFRRHLLPLLCVLGGIVAFGLTIEHLGLIAAIAAVVVLGCYQRLLSRPLEVLAIGAVLIAISVGLFIHGLGMPWTAFPS